MAGYHEAHIDLGECGGLQGFEQTVGGEEVGRLYIDAFPRVGNCFKVRHGNFFPFSQRSAGKNLYIGVARFFDRWIIARFGEEFPGGKAPVDGESRLKAIHGGPLYAGVCVAPDAPGEAVAIPVGDIHAADVSYFAVDDGDFPVIAVVELVGQLREGHFEERSYFDAGFAHFSEKFRFYPPAPHVVVEYAHLYPLSGLFDENRLDGSSQCVVVEDVILQVYEVDSFFEVLDEGVEFALSIGEYLYAVVHEKPGPAQLVTQSDLLAAFGCQSVVGIGFAVVSGVARHALQYAPFALRYHARVAVLLSEKQVENKPTYGYEYQNDNPGKTFYRIAVFKDDNDNREDNREDKTCVNPEVQPVAPRIGICSEHGLFLNRCAICAKVIFFCELCVVISSFLHSCLLFVKLCAHTILTR